MKQTYTEMEKRLLGLFPKDGSSINTVELADLYYSHPPFNARQLIVDRLNRIKRKSDINDEDWELHVGGRSGPRPMECRIAPRDRTNASNSTSVVTTSD